MKNTSFSARLLMSPMGSPSRSPRRTRPRLAAVNRREPLRGRREPRTLPERVGDELRGLGGAVAALLGEDPPRGIAQALGVRGRSTRGGQGRGGVLAGERE